MIVLVSSGSVIVVSDANSGDGKAGDVKAGDGKPDDGNTGGDGTVGDDRFDGSFNRREGTGGGVLITFSGTVGGGAREHFFRKRTNVKYLILGQRF